MLDYFAQKAQKPQKTQKPQKPQKTQKPQKPQKPQGKFSGVFVVFVEFVVFVVFVAELPPDIKDQTVSIPPESKILEILDLETSQNTILNLVLGLSLPIAIINFPSLKFYPP